MATAPASAPWRPGQVIARREVLGQQPDGLPVPEPLPAWWGGTWLGMASHVVTDNSDALVTYVGPGAQLQPVAGRWPSADGAHPWHQRQLAWTGHGALMVHPRGADHAIWHFWDGPDRTFSCWYINLQTAYRRTESTLDTQDLELDLIVWPDGSVEVKDADLMATRVAEGRFSQALVGRVEADCGQLLDDLRHGRRWWDPDWAHWEPDPSWRGARLPAGWLDVPTAPSQPANHEQQH